MSIIPIIIAVILTLSVSLLIYHAWGQIVILILIIAVLVFIQWALDNIFKDKKDNYKDLNKK